MFFKGLKAMRPNAAILTAVISIPQMETGSHTPTIRTLPPTIMSLHHLRYAELNEEELKLECKRVFEQELVVMQAEADYLEQSTRLQSRSLTWFSHRRGRITASKFGSVFRTSPFSPAQSLVDSLLKPPPKIHSPSLEWGVTNEPRVREEYQKIIQVHHTSFKVDASGLVVNPTYPYLGASPDGLVSCSCCGEGLLEIKCPYSIREQDPTTVTGGNFYLKVVDGCLQLSKEHNYYYQIQGQLALCNRSYCDFVCWTPCGVHIERVVRDESFWNQMQPKLQTFFVEVLLPKILSPQPINSSNKENTSPNQAKGDVYCFCRKGEKGRMIACDNPLCPYEWFHFRCVSLSAAPKGKWFCPECCKNCS